MAGPKIVAVAGRSRELAKRIAVAVVGLPCVAWVVKSDARASAVMFSAAATVACWEYYRLVFGGMPRAAWIGILAGAAMPLIPVFVPAADAGVALFAVLGTLSTVTWVALLLGGPRATGPERAGHVVAGALFCSVGLVALSALRAGRQGSAWTAMVLIAAWANDTCAYLVGRTFGKRPMWPEVSPGKTWEGFLGGLCGGVAVLLVVRFSVSRSQAVDAWLPIGIMGGLLGPLGDLCKSMLKRAYHAKDTGRLLPGHGGILDRIDSVLFIAPAVWLLRMVLLRR